jgi:phospholipid N-methyltransferase
MASDYVTFVKELPKCFGQIGAMIPSSTMLGRAMVKSLREAHRPASILEVGPGTGPITRQILRAMGLQDRLTICEINPRFMRQLEEKLEKDPYFRTHRGRTSFFLGPIQEFPVRHPEQKFDFIISSLPFSNFTPSEVEDILQQYRALLNPGGRLSFVEYVGIRKLRALFSSKERRRKVKAVDDVVDGLRREVRSQGGEERDIELLNVPPAHVFHLQFGTNGRVRQRAA